MRGNALEKKQPYVFAVSGWKNAGKTTLVKELIKHLSGSGYQVATVKHDGHDFEVDVPGTDTHCHQKAGAYGTAVFSDNRFLISKQQRNISEKELFPFFPEADIIILEGFKHSIYPKYVVREENRPGKEQIKQLGNLIGAGMRGEVKLGTVKAVCLSEKKGTAKRNIGKCEIVEGFGLKDDAHGGNWHRQVSLLSLEKIEKFREKGAEVEFGDFGENLVVEGFDFSKMEVGTRFQCNDVELELTQIGKECHHGCQIFQKMGDCIMPREGVFCKVLSGGVIEVGDVFAEKK